MRWLIVEDALQNRKGHWLESVRTFRNGLLTLGDSVTVLASKKAEHFIHAELAARPVLPESIWHRMSDGSRAWKRYLRVPVHALKTWWSVRAVLKKEAEYDLIFVPTVSVHHLLGWVRLIKGPLRNSRARILLNFIHPPICVQSDGSVEWIKSPTTRLMAKLMESLRTELECGKVIFGVETEPFRKAFSQVAGIPVRCLPPPVEPYICQMATRQHDGLLFGCYGPARHEKGSDILIAAVGAYLKTHPDSRARFAVHWPEDFHMPDGILAGVPSFLEQHPSVEIIRRFMTPDEYAQRIVATDILLLPYRKSSYNLRGSRLVVEAVEHGIPTVTTRGTVLAQQAEEFGATVLCENENVESLVSAIETIERTFPKLNAQAEASKFAAREHFSVRHFRDIIVNL